MANRGETSSAKIHPVFVETSFDTRLGILVDNDESILNFKERLCKEHYQCFPELGQVKISTLKVKHHDNYYHLADSIDLRKFLDGISQSWFIYVDAVRVGKRNKNKNKNKKKQKPNISLGNTLLAARKSYNLGSNPENLLEAKSGPASIEKNKKRKISSIEHSSDQSFSRKRPDMSTGNQDNRPKISTSLSKDHADANESKHSPSKGVEAAAYPSTDGVSAHCAALEETDALFTPTKKDTENDATHLKKSIEVADNTKDDSISKQIQKEKAGMVDSIVGGGGKKHDQVKMTLDLYASDSFDGSSSSNKPKERKGRVQPTSSCTSHLQLSVKNDFSGSHSNASVLKGAVNNKNEVVKKSSNSLTTNNSCKLKNKAVKENTINMGESLEISNAGTVCKEKTENDNERGEGSRLATRDADNLQTTQLGPPPDNQQIRHGNADHVNQKDNNVGGDKVQNQVLASGATSKNEKKSLVLQPGGSSSSMKPEEKKATVQLAGSGVKIDRSGAVKVTVKSDKEAVNKSHDLHPRGSVVGSLRSTKPKENISRVLHLATSGVKNVPCATVKVLGNSNKKAVEKSSNSIKHFSFEDIHPNHSLEEEAKTSHVTLKSPSQSSSGDGSSDMGSSDDGSSDEGSSDDDNDASLTKHGNNLAGGTKFLGSLQDILRSSASYKKAFLVASQSQSEVITDNESPALDHVPVSKAK